MSLAPFDLPGRFWRGNLHTHTDRSDGALPPAEVARRYREAGYDFLAITDHFQREYDFPLTDTRELRTSAFTTLIGAELHAPRTELTPAWHIIAVGLPLDFPPLGAGETGPSLARRASDTGAFVGIAHPAASLLTLADADRLDAADAVEVYNELGTKEDRGDSWHLCDVLLARGRRLTAFAADDAHFHPGDPPGMAAWVRVRAASLSPSALLAALKSGHFYSSTGPELHDVRIRRGRVFVRCTPVTTVLVSGGFPGGEVRRGAGITECSLPIYAGAGYCRITVIDSAGRRAWTNPIWLT